METNWFAVYTRPRWEKRVAGILSKNNIENYCPLNSRERRSSDRKKRVEKPVFPSYVFVRATANQHSEIRRIDGIVTFVYWLSRPAVIRDDEIEVIRDFLKTHKNVSTSKKRLPIFWPWLFPDYIWHPCEMCV